MTEINPSIRTFLLTIIKSFPWAYKTQGEVLAGYLDYLIADRTTSWASFQRLGIADITGRQCQYSLEKAQFHLEELHTSLTKRFTKLDRRERIVIATDDTGIRRYGKDVFGAARQYDHAGGGTQERNVFVDCWVSSLHYVNYDFAVYLPQKYLDRHKERTEELHTKIELANDCYRKFLQKLTQQGVRPVRLWCTNDSWYACAQTTTTITEFGANFTMNIAKDTRCNLFGTAIRIDEIFAKTDHWRYITPPSTRTQVWFQEKTLNLVSFGRCKVFAVRRGNETDLRYYAVNRLRTTIQLFVEIWGAHWNVERLHDAIKNTFNLGACHSGRESINQSYWRLVYLAYYFFALYQRQYPRTTFPRTLRQLWEDYCLAYDIAKAKVRFRTTQQVQRAKNKLRGSWC